MKKRGYLYSPPPLHDSQNAPTCQEYSEDILVKWAFSKFGVYNLSTPTELRFSRSTEGNL